jgi:AcrR family transcriptional regulator
MTTEVMTAGEAGNRRGELLQAAARHFARGGFDAASMRDIARDAGMLAGSIYYHFPSKDELIAAVYAVGVEQVIAAVETALAAKRDPWARLEAAAVAHLEALLARSPFPAVLIVDLTRLSPGLRRRLVGLRDRYERRFAELVAALPLPSGVDRRLLRLQLLGSLNWTPTWYRPGQAKPAEIARAFVRTLRGG